MPRTVCLMAFSYEDGEEGMSRHNFDLAEETENVYRRFLFDNREENNLHLMVVAQREIANILNEKIGMDVDIPIGWTVTPGEKLTAVRLMDQTLTFIKNSATKEVIVIAPFWKVHTFRRLAKKANLVPIKMKIKRIGLWPSSPRWWRNSFVRLLFRSLTSPFRD